MNWTLITGAAKGLGEKICCGLASKGHNILVHYNKSEHEALNIVKKCRDFGVYAEKIQGNLSTDQKMEDFLQILLKDFSSIQNLINNVGNYCIAPALETSFETWKNLFQTNLHAPFRLIQACIPEIVKNQGSIINIGVAGLNSISADTYSTAYTMTKSSLWMLTKSLAKELASVGISVNMVSPGYLENSVDLPENLLKLPMKRPALFTEVVQLIAFLLEKENRYITGQNIEVAGGVRLG